jgi:hypothetical protein
MLVVILCLMPLHLLAVVAGDQGQQLGMVLPVVLVVVVLRTVVLVALALVGKGTMEPQIQQIKPVVVVVQPLPDRLMATAAMERHLVFLVLL